MDVTGSEKKISDAVDSQLKSQSLLIDAVNESVQKAQKTATENSETLHDMLVGIENLRESVKQLRAEIRGWEESGGPEEPIQGNQELDSLMKEVPLNIPMVPQQSQPPTQTQTVNIPVPLTSMPIFAPQASRPIVSADDPEL